MKKQILLTIAIIFSIQFAFAQIDEIKVKEVGSFIYDKKNSFFTDQFNLFVDKNDNSCFYLPGDELYNFIKLDKTKSRREIDVDVLLPKNKNRSYSSFIRIGNKIYNFNQYVSKEKKYKLTASEIDFNTGSASEEKTIIEKDELNRKPAIPLSLESTDEIAFVFIPKRDKLLVVYTLAEDIKSGESVMKTVGFCELDENLTITAKGEGVFPRNDFNKFSYYVDKYKNFIVLNNVDKDKQVYEISYLLYGHKRFKTIKLVSNERRIREICFNELDSTINVVGYVSSKKKYEVKPQYLNVYNVNLFNNTITEIQSSSISSDVLNDSIIKRMMRVNNPTAIMSNLFYEINAKKIESLPNGNKVVICSGYSFSFVGKYTEYINTNLFVLYLDKDWKITKSYFLNSQNEDIIDNMLVGKDALYFLGRVYSTDKLKLWSKEGLGAGGGKDDMARYNNLVLFKYGFDGSYSEKVLNEKIGRAIFITKVNDKKIVYVTNDYRGVYNNEPEKLHYHELELAE